jgi:RNA polymerase sigma-70 factor, ECF subfamily
VPAVNLTKVDAAAREPEASRIAEIIRTHYSGVLRLVRSKLRDAELAADLINEAIAMTLEHHRQGRLRHSDNIPGYVFKVAMNLLRNHRRDTDNRPKARVEVEVLQDLAQYDADGIETEQIRREALAVLDSLKLPRDREALKRFYVDEQDKAVICRDLGLTQQQFALVISRARERMRQLFQARGLRRTDFFCVLSLVLLLLSDRWAAGAGGD